MRFLLSNHIAIARQSIRGNRLRSFLTMLGIAIGVASITTILSLSAGATHIIRAQVDELGGNVAVIRTGASTSSMTEKLSSLTQDQASVASSLTDADITTIKQIPHVSAIAPLMILQGTVAGDTATLPGSTILATTPDLQTISRLGVRDGQFLDDSLSPATAVVGPQLSIDTFGTEQSIGKTLRIKGQSFTVIGVLERENKPINYNGVDFDNAVLIPFSSGQALNQGAAHIQQINVQSDSVDNLGGVITTINKKLLKNHYNEADFSVLSGAQIAEPTSQLFMAVAGVSVAIAAISLVVGGVGVMNIILVSVAERTREIGIRKALGASNRDIIAQFMIESLALSLGGGIGGYILGYVAAFTISSFLTFNPAFTWEIAAITILLSVGVGTIFGIYPAVRAARKDPITALRQYE